MTRLLLGWDSAAFLQTDRRVAKGDTNVFYRPPTTSESTQVKQARSGLISELQASTSSVSSQNGFEHEGEGRTGGTPRPATSVGLPNKNPFMLLDDLGPKRPLQHDGTRWHRAPTK